LQDLDACAQAHPSAFARAVQALARGRAGKGDAARWFREATDAFASAQLPFETASAQLALAREVAPTRPDAAAAHAHDALKTFERLHAGRHVDETRALLRSLGEKVASPRGSGQGLTRREQEVLRLIGEGLSNPEIAQRLFISRKTVEHHVGHVLAKLGLRNRSEAAAFAARDGSAVK
jgi:DNA-binding NarL/FixJ family response regulator